MAFDITSVLKNVPNPDTETEQIEYIDLNLIDPDPDNFYSLEGLDDLAANIELIGLQQPLRVRTGEAGHVIVVSGHRRRAACLMLRDGGNEKFRRVACIREQGEVSEAMRELRLIYANASTRVMGAAELSKQAERVEMLLYKLKEEGTEFPGRMRDHVAQACQVSKSKLSRLHAIRSNMAPDLLSSCFDGGLMAESVAYELSKHEIDTQRWIVDTYKATHPNSKISDMQEWWVKNFADCAAKMAEMHCREIAGGGECIHQREHVEHIWRRGYEGWEGCVSSSEGREPICCADCESLASCSISCPRCERKKTKLKADLKAQRQSERETKKAEELRRKDEEELEESQAALYWARLGGALIDAGMSFDELQRKLAGKDSYRDDHLLQTYSLSRQDAENLLAGRPAKNDNVEVPVPFHWDQGPKEMRQMAMMGDLLGVSLDYLFMRTDDPKGGATPQWSTGSPTAKGVYSVRIGVGKEETPQATRYATMEWDGNHFVTIGTGVPVRAGETVFRWYKLPEV